MKSLKRTKILTIAALALLIVPSLIQTSSTPRPSAPRVSYNPPPGDIFHAPLSDMGLIGFAQARPEISGLTGSIGASTNTAAQPGPQTISQNALRFITDTSYFPQTETSVAVDPSNPTHVLGGFNDLKFFFCPFLPADCAGSAVPASISGFTVSIDGGSSVLKSSDIQDISLSGTPLTSFGDPSVAASVDGNFFYGSLAIARFGGGNGVMIAKSNPNLFNPSVSCVTDRSNPLTNACWTATFVSGNPGAFPNTFEDKPLIAVDHNKGKFLGSVYVAWDHFNFTTGQSSSSLARCDNLLTSCTMLAGGTLPPLSLTDKFVAFTTPAVDRDGNVAVAWCNYGTRLSFGPVTCKVRSSTAGGTRFGAASTILSFMGPGTTLPNDTVTVGFATEQFRTSSIPSLAVDASPTSTSGNLYFAIQVCTSGHYIAVPLFGAVDNPGNCGFSSILFSSSTNRGLTWSSPAIVSQPAVNAQPWVTVDSTTGNVFVVYYTTQFDPFNHRIDVVASKSTNGGSSFTQVRVTSVSNEPDSDPNMFFYLSPFGGSWVTPQYGDYFQASAIGGTLWVLFTANYAVEAGTFQTDPFLAVLTRQ